MPLITATRLASLVGDAADAKADAAQAREDARLAAETGAAAVREAREALHGAETLIRDAARHTGHLEGRLAAAVLRITELQRQMEADAAAELAGAVAAARDYAWETAAGEVTARDYDSSKYGMYQAAVQEKAAVIEGFLSPGYGDLADLRLRLMAARRVYATKKPPWNKLLPDCAEAVYLWLRGTPGDPEEMWEAGGWGQ